MPPGRDEDSIYYLDRIYVYTRLRTHLTNRPAAAAAAAMYPAPTCRTAVLLLYHTSVVSSTCGQHGGPPYSTATWLSVAGQRTTAVHTQQ